MFDHVSNLSICFKQLREIDDIVNTESEMKHLELCDLRLLPFQLNNLYLDSGSQGQEGNILALLLAHGHVLSP